MSCSSADDLTEHAHCIRCFYGINCSRCACRASTQGRRIQQNPFQRNIHERNADGQAASSIPKNLQPKRAKYLSTVVRASYDAECSSVHLCIYVKNEWDSNDIIRSPVKSESCHVFANKCYRCPRIASLFWQWASFLRELVTQNKAKATIGVRNVIFLLK